MPIKSQSRDEGLDSLVYFQRFTSEVFPQPSHNIFNHEHNDEEYFLGTDLIAPIPVYSYSGIISDRLQFCETESVFQTDVSVTATQKSFTAKTFSLYTLSDAYEAIGVGKLHWLLLLFCSLGYAAASSHAIFIGTILPYITSYYDYRLYTLAFLPSLSLAFTYLGSWLWTSISDIKGRRPIMVVCPLLSSIFGLLCCLSPNFSILVSISCLQGLSIGGCLKVDLVYYLEILPKSFHKRHIWLFHAYGFAFGALYASICAYLILPSGGWKYGYLANSILPFILFIARLVWSFESPFYTLYHDHSIPQVYKILHLLSSINETSLPHGQLIILPSDTGITDLPKGFVMSNCINVFDKDSLFDISNCLSIYWFLLCFVNSSWIAWIPELFRNVKIQSSIFYCMIAGSFTVPIITTIIYKIVNNHCHVNNSINESKKLYFQFSVLIFLTSAGFSILALCVNTSQRLFFLCVLGISWSFLWLVSIVNLEKIFLFPVEHSPNLMKSNTSKFWWFRRIQSETVCQIFGTALGPFCSAALLDATVYYFSSRIILYSIGAIICISFVPLFFSLFHINRSR